MLDYNAAGPRRYFGHIKDGSVSRLHRISAPFFILVLLLLASVSLHANAQTPIWRNDWTISAPPVFQAGLDPWVTSSPDGDLLMGSRSINSLDYQFARFTDSGAVRWKVNLDGGWGVPYGDSGVRALLANADGSALVTMGDPGDNIGNIVAKVDPSGAIAWTRQLSAQGLVAQSAQLITIADCHTVIALDAASGRPAWQYTYSLITTPCLGQGLVADSQGNVYVIFSANAWGGHATGFRTLKLDVYGHVIWDISTNSQDTPALVGVGGSFLYVTTQSNQFADSTVRAIRVGDGSTAWIAPPSTANLVLAGNPAELITESQDAVQRLAADTGLPRWSQPVLGGLAVINGDIIVEDEITMTRLDAQTGAVVWTAPLPNTDTSGYHLSIIHIAVSGDGNITAVAQSSPISYGDTNSLFLQRFDFNSGQILNRVFAGAITHGVSGVSKEEDAAHVIAAAFFDGQVHVRRLNSVDGALDWESIDASREANQRNPLGIAVAGDAIAVADTTTSGALRVGAFDRASGMQRWATELYVYNQIFTYASDPVADSSGNIFIDYGADMPCQPPPFYPQTFCSRQTLVKLSAADGAVLWRYVNETGSGFAQGYGNVYPQTFAMIGSDVVLAGPFVGPNAASTLIRLSGIDGSVLWSSSVSPMYGISEIYPLSDGNIMANGDVLARIDGATGNTISANSYAQPAYECTVACEIDDSLALPNGDIVYAGKGNYQPSVILLHSQPGGMEEHWYLGPGSPILSSSASFLSRDSAGQVWVRLVRRFRGEQQGQLFLAGLNLSSGTLLGEQALSPFDYDPLISSLTYDPMHLAPENNRLLSETIVVDSPLPTTSGNALLDTTVTANGDLSVQLTLDHSKVKAGDTVGFHFIATYSGDAPIGGAHLRGYLPWTGGLGAVSCAVQKASNCVIDTRSGNIQASFDIKPGGKIDISGQARVLIGSENPLLEAFVYGPTGLMEQDTINNFARAGLVESIFFSGFE